MFKFSLCTSIPHKLCAVPWLAKYICVSMKRDVNKELLTSIYLGIKIGGRARSRRLRQGHPLSNASYIWKYFINCYKNCFEFEFQTIVNTFTTRTVNGTLIDVIIAKCYNQRPSIVFRGTWGIFPPVHSESVLISLCLKSRIHDGRTSAS